MYYLLLDPKVICKWCRKELIQIVEDEPSKLIIRLCPVCDRWPPGFLERSRRKE